MINPIRHFKNFIFVLQYIFDISFYKIRIAINVFIFLFHCYFSKKGFKKKLKQTVDKKLIYRYVRKKIKYQKIIKLFKK